MRLRRLKKLPRSFYLRPTPTVAKDLLGKYIIRKFHRRFLIGKIVEVEAYCEGDPASHSYRGVTERNKVMFGKGGCLYVYFTYGMHFCANVVTRGQGIGEAVLIRAVEPIEGIERMKKNRGFRKSGDADLTNGPAKFCEAFGIGRQHNGVDLLSDTMFVAGGRKIPRNGIGSSGRIGIRNATDKRWRFFVKKNRFASRP